jgi:hypothetical protein
MMKFCLGRNLFLTLCQEINWSCYFELRFTVQYTASIFSAFAYVAFDYIFFSPLFMMYATDLISIVYHFYLDL